MSAPAGTCGAWPLPPVGRAAVRDDLTGLWARDLLRWYDADSDDTATRVRWLQAGDYYVDLRVPPGRPDFSAVRSLDHVDQAAARWMLTQEAFGGRIIQHEGETAGFIWDRAVDWALNQNMLDSGTLHFEGSLLAERGLLQPYIEHSRRQPVSGIGHAWATWKDPDSSAHAVLVRVGDTFGFARGRRSEITSLTDQFDPVIASPAEIAAALDCEVSLGTVTGDVWMVTDSTLPFLENEPLFWRLVGSALEVPTHEFQRRTSWPVDDLGGDLGLLAA